MSNKFYNSQINKHSVEGFIECILCKDFSMKQLKEIFGIQPVKRQKVLKYDAVSGKMSK